MIFPETPWCFLFYGRWDEEGWQMAPFQFLLFSPSLSWGMLRKTGYLFWSIRRTSYTLVHDAERLHSRLPSDKWWVDYFCDPFKRRLIAWEDSAPIVPFLNFCSPEICLWYRECGVQLLCAAWLLCILRKINVRFFNWNLIVTDVRIQWPLRTYTVSWLLSLGGGLASPQTMVLSKILGKSEIRAQFFSPLQMRFLPALELFSSTIQRCKGPSRIFCALVGGKFSNAF